MSCLSNNSAAPLLLQKANCAQTQPSNLGIESIQLLNPLQQLNRTHCEQYEANTYSQLCEMALSMGKVAIRNRSTEIASILNQFGGILFEQGNVEGAINAYKQGLAIELEVYGFFHPNIVITLKNLGYIYDRRGENDACLQYFEKVVEIQRFLCGDSHPDMLSTLSSIASIHYRKNDHVEALYIYQEILRINRKVHGPNHLEVAANLSSIGHTLFQMGLYELALHNFDDSLQILRSLCHKRQDIACILSNVAAIHLKLGDDDQALSCFHEVLEMHRSELGNLDEDVVSALRQIGLIYYNRGEFCNAIDCLNEILQIQKKLLESNQATISSIAQTLKDIGNIYLQNGQTAKMVSALSDASRYLRLSGASEDDLELSDFSFYELAKMHPECAPVA